MSSGLTRRRGAGAGASDPNDENSSRVQSPAPKNTRDGQPETSYESGENGHKIAFDPRDMNESAERSKQPKLTMMEEVLLLGLKDKQVCDRHLGGREGWLWGGIENKWSCGLRCEAMLTAMNDRDTSASGTITSHTRSEDA
jgi:Golgi phosphoprotein 3